MKLDEMREGKTFQMLLHAAQSDMPVVLITKTRVMTLTAKEVRELVVVILEKEEEN
jgi:hypothetical protein